MVHISKTLKIEGKPFIFLKQGAVNLKLDRHKYISLDPRFLECSAVGDLVELWPQMAMGKA